MSDPKRLREGDAPDELRKLLIAAEADVLDDAAAERVRGRVAAVVAVATAGSLTNATKMTTASKSIALALVAAAIGGGAYVYSKSGPPQNLGVPSASSVVASTPSASASSEPPPGVVASETSAPPPEVDAGAPTAKSSVKIAPAPPPSPREGLLLLQARQALNHDPARALALIRQHEREFPNSQLGPERAKLLAAALARKGD